MALADSHQLIGIEKGLPGGRVSRKDVNAELAEQKKSDQDRSSVSVDVYAGYLRECRNHQNATANWLKKQGLPWSFGQVLVPNNKVADVVAYLDDAKLHNEMLYQSFLDNFPARMEEDKKTGRLGDLYEQDDYQSVERLRSKWKFEVMRDTVPDPEKDPRAGWANAEMESMKKAMKEQEDAHVKEATIELLKRLVAPIKNIVDKTARYDGGRDGRFNTNSFINNVRDVVETIPSLNLRDDPELDQIRRQVIAEICQLDPQDLRDDPDLRKKANESATDILDRVGNFGSSL